MTEYFCVLNFAWIHFMLWKEINAFKYLFLVTMPTIKKWLHYIFSTERNHVRFDIINLNSSSNWFTGNFSGKKKMLVSLSFLLSPWYIHTSHVLTAEGTSLNSSFDFCSFQKMFLLSKFKLTKFLLSMHPNVKTSNQALILLWTCHQNG